MRELIILHLLHWKKPRIFAISARGDQTLLADEQAAVAAGRRHTVHLCIETRVRVSWLPLLCVAGGSGLRHWRRAREIRLRENLPDDLRLPWRLIGTRSLGR